MKSRINNEVPDADQTLVAVRIDLVVILYLVCDQLEELSTSEFHLLFVVLVLNNIGASPISDAELLIAPLLVGHRVYVFRNALAKVCIVAAGIVIDGIIRSVFVITL